MDLFARTNQLSDSELGHHRTYKITGEPLKDIAASSASSHRIRYNFAA